MSVKNIIKFVCGAAAALGAAAGAAEPPLAASIAPLHSLLAGVAVEDDNVILVIPPADSPHTARLSPSQARALHGAAAVFYIGEHFETFLRGALDSLPPAVHRVPVARGITLLPARGVHADDEHGAHEKENGEHDEHGGEHEKAHEHEEEHAAGAKDFHLWLDPQRARHIVRQMAQTLAEIRPARRAEYEANARRLDEKLTALDAALAEMLSGARGRYAAAHDAYQYFEHRYGLMPAVAPGGHGGKTSARRLQDARRAAAKHNIRCLFAEPQTPPRMLAAFTENAQMEIVVVSPLGAGLPPGKDLYFNLMQNMGRAFARCLTAP
ncbi:MAG: zinc ABC transporter substrate-binding protein [Gammaproteobacteria bacterium]